MPDVTNRHREPNGQFADENRNTALFNEQNVNTRAKLEAMCTSIEQGEYDNEIHADLENLGVDTSNGIFATESGWQAIRNYYSGQVEGYASYGSVEDFEHGADDRFTAKEVTQLAEMNAVTPVKSLVGGHEQTELQVNKTFSDRYIKDAVPYNPTVSIDSYGNVYNHHDYTPSVEAARRGLADDRAIRAGLREGIQAEQDAKNHTYITADGAITDAGDMEIAVTNADNTYFNDHPMWNGAFFIKNDWLNKYADKPINDNVRVHVSNAPLETGHSGDPDTLVFDRLGRGYEPLPDDEKENYINALNRAISINKQKAGSK